MRTEIRVVEPGASYYIYRDNITRAMEEFFVFNSLNIGSNNRQMYGSFCFKNSNTQLDITFFIPSLQDKMIFFVDIDKKFFWASFISADFSRYDPNSEDRYNAISGFREGNGMAVNYFDYNQQKTSVMFNLPDVSLSRLQTFDDEIPIFQLLSTKTKAVIPDVYTTWVKMFLPGLRMTDQNGNKWVTLGGTLLYKES